MFFLIVHTRLAAEWVRSQRVWIGREAAFQLLTNRSNAHFCCPCCVTCQESQRGWLAFALRLARICCKKNKHATHVEHAAKTRQVQGNQAANMRRHHPVERSQTTTRQIRPDSEASTTQPQSKRGNSVTNAYQHFLVASGSYPFSIITYHRKWIFKDL